MTQQKEVTMTQVNIGEVLMAAADQIAKEHGVSPSEVVRRALRNYLPSINFSWSPESPYFNEKDIEWEPCDD